jgi:transposase InsO family protein/predicted aspartyl protease
MKPQGEVTLVKAIDAARHKEVVGKQQKLLRHDADSAGSGHDAASVDAVKKSMRDTKSAKKSVEKCKDCRMSAHDKSSDCPAREKKCFDCGVYGHFKGSLTCKQQKTRRNGPKRYSTNVDEASGGSEDESIVSLGEIAETSGEANPPYWAKCQVNGTGVKFKADTGADETIINDKMAKKLRLKLQPTNRKFVGPGRTPLKVSGVAKATISRDGISTVTNVYVLRRQKNPLLGRREIRKLGLLPNQIDEVGEDSVQHSSVTGSTEGSDLLPCMKSPEGEFCIQTEPNARAFRISAPRRIPIALRLRLKLELDRMLRAGVIRPVTAPTEWCSPIVIVPRKQDDRLRITVDFTELNKCVKREQLLLPSVDESLAQLAGAKVFSKLDTLNGFWQVPLVEQCKPLTTFITPYGRYQFNRMPFGISSAPEHFQRLMMSILEGLEGVISHSDDILVYGRDKDEHKRRLDQVRERLAEYGVTLNLNKCQFGVSCVTFLGHIVSSAGISADPEKTRAISEFPRPSNADKLRKFLGMVNYLMKFVPVLSHELKVLRELLGSKVQWVWTEEHERAFVRIKGLISDTVTLAHYDPNKPLRVCADASSDGLGAVLEQQEEPSVWRPVAYASRSLSDVEKRYAQIEKEALALTWACERFSVYITGLCIELLTDHKPLVPIFNDKPLSEMSARLQRFKMRLMCFSCVVRYVPGSQLHVPDALSRSALPRRPDVGADILQDEVELQVPIVLDELNCTRLEVFRDSQKGDAESLRVRKAIEANWPASVYKSDPFFKYRDHLVVHNELIMYDHRLFVPRQMRRDVLERAHTGHFGVTKGKARLRQCAWWPGMMSEMCTFVTQCNVCLKHRSNPAEPLIPTALPDRPWQVVALDLCVYERENYLVVQDYFSRFIEAKKLTSTTSSRVISVLTDIFARHGIPEKLVTDCGTQFVSAEMHAWATKIGMRIRTSSPEFHQSNGLAERAVATVKGILKKNKNLETGLLAYRSSPLEHGYSPAQLLYGRNIRNMMPMPSAALEPGWPDLEKFKRTDSAVKNRQATNFNRRHGARKDLRPLEVGERVWVIDLKCEGRVARKLKEERSYSIELSGSARKVRRNRFHLQPLVDDTRRGRPTNGSSTDMMDIPVAGPSSADLWQPTANTAGVPRTVPTPTPPSTPPEMPPEVDSPAGVSDEGNPTPVGGDVPPELPPVQSATGYSSSGPRPAASTGDTGPGKTTPSPLYRLRKVPSIPKAAKRLQVVSHNVARIPPPSHGLRRTMRTVRPPTRLIVEKEM